jgi:hypothetical protein
MERAQPVPNTRILIVTEGHEPMPVDAYSQIVMVNGTCEGCDTYFRADTYGRIYITDDCDLEQNENENENS